MGLPVEKQGSGVIYALVAVAVIVLCGIVFVVTQTL